MTAEPMPNLGEHHDLIRDRVVAVEGVESALLFVHNEDDTKVSVQVLYKGGWVTTPELADTDAACFHLLTMLEGCDA